MKKILIYILITLFLVSCVSAGTYNYLQRQGFDTPDQAFTQSEFDYSDYSIENSLSTGSKYLMVCSDDVWSTQTMPVCVGVDSSDTMFTYIYNSTLGAFIQINNDMSGINTFGAEQSTSGIAGSQSLAFADIDGDGYDELIMAGYNISSSETEAYVISGNGTDWVIDWGDTAFSGVEADQRSYGSVVSCGDDSEGTQCYLMTNDIANDHLTVWWFNDSAQSVTWVDGTANGAGTIDDNVNNPNYFTCFDVDADDEVECIFIGKDADKYAIFEYTLNDGVPNIATIIADIDALLDGSLDGTDTSENRLFMNIMDVTASAGYEYVFSALEKTGSDYNIHFLITSNTGSHIANFTVAGDANSRITQPYLCQWDNEDTCIQAKLPDGNYIIYYSNSADTFYNDSIIDSECEISDHVPYIPTFRSLEEGVFTDDYYYFTSAGMCTGARGELIFNSCTISGTAYNVITDIDNDDSYDFIWFNDDDSCLVISDLGGGTNYQPSISPLSPYYDEPLCDTENQIWTFTWSDVEDDDAQFRYKCHGNLNYSDWSIEHSDTSLNFTCPLNKSNAVANTYLTNFTCSNFWSWCTIQSLWTDTANITIWTQYPRIEIRDDASHTIYIDPTESNVGRGQWSNATNCYDDGTIDTNPSLSVCGDGVCSGAETVENCPDDCETTTTTLSDSAVYVDADSNMSNTLDGFYDSMGGSDNASRSFISLMLLLIGAGAMAYYTKNILLSGGVLIAGAWAFWMIGFMSLVIPLTLSIFATALLMVGFLMGRINNE